jgi:hypothetical protein
MRVERHVRRCLQKVLRETRLLYVSTATDCGLAFHSLRHFVDSDPVAAQRLIGRELGTFSLAKWQNTKLIARHRLIQG